MTTSKIEVCPAYDVRLYMAGDIEVARQVCREFCDSIGWCVTVTPTTYVYRGGEGGEELGFIVGAINYARFPATPATRNMKFLAIELMDRLNQQSFSIITPERSFWVSRRAEDVK
jgi:hypothetical protein